MSHRGNTPKPSIARSPLIRKLVCLEEVIWFNPRARTDHAEALRETGLTAADIQGAADRLRRFAPYLAQAFPATRSSGGIVESPVVAIPDLQAALEARTGHALGGQLWVKRDDQLPISGSIKARGSIHEVLMHAEALALGAGLIAAGDDYRQLQQPRARTLFGRHRIAVGSTGNLGLSIGIMSAQLGFRATVHMSSDARQWKKDRLRRHGVEVMEYRDDYSVAVAAGRRQAASDPYTYFVDDENSLALFLGYAVAALRLAGQLQALDVRVSTDAPLIAYLPCGVGGAPGGITFGLKTVFGDAVRCLFVEPTHSPAMLLGLDTGLHDRVCVQDLGLDNITAADGLAVGRPSGFVGARMQGLIDGCCTVGDDGMFRLLALLHEIEGLAVEPSAAAALAGPLRLAAHPDGARALGLDHAALQRATHLAWLTGGAMVPATEMQGYVARGKKLLRPASACAGGSA